jgi:hypothetical protein
VPCLGLVQVESLQVLFLIEHGLDGQAVLILHRLDPLSDPGVGREISLAHGEVRLEQDDGKVVEALVLELGELPEVTGLAAGNKSGAT